MYCHIVAGRVLGLDPSKVDVAYAPRFVLLDGRICMEIFDAFYTSSWLADPDASAILPLLRPAVLFDHLYRHRPRSLLQLSKALKNTFVVTRLRLDPRFLCICPAQYGTMKLTILSYNCVAAWKWNASTEPHQLYTYAERGPDGQIQQTDDEDDDEVCGICQSAFESTCPECKVPGDDCPLSK
jgi:hypothetical protein